MEQAGALAMQDLADIGEMAETFLPALIVGDIDNLGGQLGANAIIDGPRLGRVDGVDTHRALLKGLHDWIDPWFPRLQHLRTTVTNRRACSEDILSLDLDGEAVELPVGTVVAKTDAPVFHIVRVYYSLWPFERHHVFRPRLFEAPASTREPAMA